MVKERGLVVGAGPTTVQNKEEAEVLRPAGRNAWTPNSNEVVWSSGHLSCCERHQSACVRMAWAASQPEMFTIPYGIPQCVASRPVFFVFDQGLVVQCALETRKCPYLDCSTDPDR